MRWLYLSLIGCLIFGITGAVQGQSASDKQAKIESAMSAALPSISANATIKDHDGSVLREGTNDWTCYPDMPDLEGQNPMCLDQQWTGWWEAYLNEETPEVRQVGIGYMLQGGSRGSNADPRATGPTPDNDWMEEGAMPHLMVIVPDLAMYEGLPTDPDNGGPWVMWAGTPFAHIMVPTAGLEE